MVSVSHFASGSATLIQCPELVGPAPSLAGEGVGGGGEKGMQWEKEEAVGTAREPLLRWRPTCEGLFRGPGF